MKTMTAEDWRDATDAPAAPHSSLKAECSDPAPGDSCADLIHSLLNEPHPGFIATPRRKRA